MKRARKRDYLWASNATALIYGRETSCPVRVWKPQGIALTQMIPVLRLYSVCCAFMAILFAYSASVQLNDPDWYFWLPLYSLASVVNMVNTVRINKTNKHLVFIAFWGGLALFVKVVIEACFWETYTIEWKEFFCLDLKKTVVREKLGSGLAVISMWLHSKALLPYKQQDRPSSQEVRSSLVFGMTLLVAVSAGLCFA
eukprot:Gb_30901 [translate_table: standard]